MEASSDDGVVIGGATVFGIGYVETLIMAIGQLTSDSEVYDDYSFGYRSIYNYTIRNDTTGAPVGSYQDYACRDQIGGTLLVPVIGIVIAAALRDGCRVPQFAYSSSTRSVTQTSTEGDANPVWVFGAIPGAILQLIGAIMIPYGLTHHTRTVALDSAGLSIDLGGMRLALVDGAPSADLGGLTLRLDF